MSFDSIANFVYGLVATPPSPPTTGTTLVLAAGTGSLLPAPPFNYTVWPAGTGALLSNAEIVRVTGVSGDTITFLRAQEGTTARTILSGDQSALTITVKIINDLEAAVDLKAPVASPTFTGVPNAPTAAPGTDTVQIATTEFVTAAVAEAGGGNVSNSGTPVSGQAAEWTGPNNIQGVAVIGTGSYVKDNSPALTGTPTAPTPAVDNNTTQLATTAMVIAQAASANPLIDGVAAPGTSTRFARGDHVHPTDTTRAPLASPTFTGTPAAPTPAPGTNTGQIASTAFVTAAVAAAVSGLLDLKGSTDCSGNPNYPAAVKGDTYYVSVAGKIGGSAGKVVEIGDVYIASADNAGGTEAAVGTSWFVLEHNLNGVLLAANNLSDVASASASRTNLGLGTAATQPSSAFDSAGAAAAAQAASQPLDAALTALAAGSDFVQLAGPASTIKVFTLPNAAATILTDNAAVTVPQGGTGVATFVAHGVLIGAGTSALAVTSAGTLGQVLTSNGASADPTFQTPGGGGIDSVPIMASATAAPQNIDYTWEILPFDTIVLDPGSVWSIGPNGGIVIPNTGVYQVICQFSFNAAGPPNHEVYWDCIKYGDAPGSDTPIFMTLPGASFQGRDVTRMLSLVAGDEVVAYANRAGGAGNLNDMRILAQRVK